MKLLTFSVGGTQINAPAGIPTGGLSDGNVPLVKILTTGVGILLVVAAIMALLYLIWGGFTWITSQGDKSKVTAARQQIIYAIIGLLVTFFAFGIINVVATFFQVNLF